MKWILLKQWGGGHPTKLRVDQIVMMQEMRNVNGEPRTKVFLASGNADTFDISLADLEYKMANAQEEAYVL